MREDTVVALVLFAYFAAVAVAIIVTVWMMFA